MNLRSLPLGILFTMSVFGADISGNSEGAHNCKAIVASIQFTCPVGWSIVDQGRPRPGTVTLGNYEPPSAKDMAAIIPAGKSTIEIIPKPNLYRNIEEWIAATEHTAPHSKEAAEAFVNKSAGKIQARCFTSAPALKKPGDKTCLFQIDGIPIMLDLFVSPKATNIPELERHIGEMIKTAHHVH